MGAGPVVKPKNEKCAVSIHAKKGNVKELFLVSSFL